jgi:hypothetical protein
MGKKSGMNNTDDISESVKNFWVKMLKLFDEDAGWKQFGSGMEKIRIRDKHPGSATLIFFLFTPSMEDVEFHQRRDQ